MRKFLAFNNVEFSAIRIYALSVSALLLIASFLAINSINISCFIRVIFSCALLIGVYASILRVCKHHCVGLMVSIGVLLLLPFLPYVQYLCYLLGLLGWAGLLGCTWKFSKHELLFLPVLIVIVLGSGIYIDFQYQRALLAGTVHIDTLFHAAIAAMYSHYGVASIGLNGLVPIAYHTLSHKIMAGISILTGFETLAVYAYLFFAMGPILLVFILASFACQLNSMLSFDRALLGISLCMLVIISVPVFRQVAMWDSYFVSESYLVGLLIFSVSLSTFLKYMESSGANYLLLVTALTLLVISGSAKASVGLLGICVFGLFGITTFRSYKYWLFLIIATIIFYLTISAAASSAKELMPVLPLHFVYTYVAVSFKWPILIKLFLFISLHFLPVWICLINGVRRFGVNYLKTIEFQVLFALLIPAIFFALTFEIAGGSAYYFSSIPVIISLPFLVSNMINLLSEIKFKHIICASVFATLLVFPAILHRSFLKQHDQRQVDNIALQQIVKRLQYVRDNSTTNTIIKIDDPAYLVKIIGCNAYWFLPAVLERPIENGLPDSELCPDLGSTFYGLSDYNLSDKKLTSDSFKVLIFNLKNN